MLLAAGRPRWVRLWAQRGLAPLTLTSMAGWTLVTPAGPLPARPPYDDVVQVLAARPAGLLMAPVIGLFQVGHQAVLTVQPRRWPVVQRWAVWTPGEGLVFLPGLTPARTVEVVAAAYGRTGGAAGGGLAGEDGDGHAAPDVKALRRALHQRWRDGSGSAEEVLAATWQLLGLPGHDVFTGRRPADTLPGARTIRPHPRHARAFNTLIRERDEDAQEAP